MSIEVEIKSQVPSRDWLLGRIKPFNPKVLKSYKHLNHYWLKPSIDVMRHIGSRLHLLDTPSFQELVTVGRSPSMRSRCTYQDKPSDVPVSELIVKYTIGSDSSDHGVSRLEFTVPIPMPIEELDNLLAACGAQLQAKWSREAWLILVDGEIEIQVGFSPGYGWIAEFEKIASNPAQAIIFEKEIRAFMSKIGVEEIAQRKLDAMFSFYNAHWQDYYLSDKTFDSSKM